MNNKNYNQILIEKETLKAMLKCAVSKGMLEYVKSGEYHSIEEIERIEDEIANELISEHEKFTKKYETK